MARAGALLCPQGLSDGELIGVARLLGSPVSELVKRGRAHVNLGDGRLIIVTGPQQPNPDGFSAVPSCP